MDIKKFGLKELSESEAKNVNGGSDYIVLSDWRNPIVDIMVSFYNAGSWIWNCVTGQEGGYIYL